MHHIIQNVGMYSVSDRVSQSRRA